MQQYSRHFFAPAAAADVQRLLTGLEMNWDGDAVGNSDVARTLQAAERLDNATKGEKPGNWRLQAHLLRAFYVSRPDRICVRVCCCCVWLTRHFSAVRTRTCRRS